MFHENLKRSYLSVGNFNGHIGKNADGNEGVHSGRGFGRRNLEGERILEFAVKNNLVLLKRNVTR